MTTLIPSLKRQAQLRTLIAAFAAASTLASAGIAQAGGQIYFPKPDRPAATQSQATAPSSGKSAIDQPRRDNRDYGGSGRNDNRGTDQPSRGGGRDNGGPTSRPVFVPNPSPVNDRRNDNHGNDNRDNRNWNNGNRDNDHRDNGNWNNGNRDRDHRDNDHRPTDYHDRRNDNHVGNGWKVAAGVGLGLIIGAAIGSHNSHSSPAPVYAPNDNCPPPAPVYRDNCPVRNDYYADNGRYGDYSYDGGGYHQDGYQSLYGEETLTGVVMEQYPGSEFFIRHGHDRIHVVMNRRLPDNFSAGDSIFLRGSFNGDTFYAFDVDITRDRY